MIDIVIVNWNSGSHLKGCISSIREFGLQLVSSITVVDNNSSDDSELCCVGLGHIKLLRAEENLGFGRGCNRGALDSGAPYLLFLNPDAALFPTTLQVVLEYMNDPGNTSVGICGVQLLDENGRVARSCSRFPSPLSFFFHAFGLARILPRLGGFMTDWDHSKTMHVDQVIGAFFLVRRGLFEALEGFDERFFVYFEEVDFSYRAQQAGWQSAYLSSAQAFHLGGGTSSQVKAHRLFYSLRSRLLYASKHFSLTGASITLVAALFIEPVSRCALALVRRSFSGLKETCAAYAMLWGWLPSRLRSGRPR